MISSILVGAGAEAGAPYHIPGGQSFTWETCYTRNTRLYDALEKYYSPILHHSDASLNLPNKYQSIFLYEANNASFADLVNVILSSREGTDLVTTLIGADFLNRKPSKKGVTLNDDELRFLYDSLIKNVGADSHVLLNLKDLALKHLPDDAYFGIIEGYFSSLLNPARRNQSFWKLINYYWSAFFAVAEPIIEHLYSNDALFKELGIYQFTLKNLFDVIHSIFSCELIESYKRREPDYYTELSGLFDYALTTNYTPFIESMEVKKACKPIRLSGSLSQFESVPGLRIYDLVEESPADQTFLFPFVMTQVPVKPLIDYRQIFEYAHAIEAIDTSDLVVVLGYSLCQNDAHICSLLREHIYKCQRNRIIYLSYQSDTNGQSITPSDITEKLRASEEHASQIEVIEIGEGGKLQLSEIRCAIQRRMENE